MAPGKSGGLFIFIEQHFDLSVGTSTLRSGPRDAARARDGRAADVREEGSPRLRPPELSTRAGVGGAIRIRWPYWSFSVPPGEDEAQDVVEVSVAG